MGLGCSVALGLGCRKSTNKADRDRRGRRVASGVQRRMELSSLVILLMIEILSNTSRTLNSGNYGIYSLLWVLRDFYHQPYSSA